MTARQLNGRNFIFLKVIKKKISDLTITFLSFSEALNFNVASNRSGTSAAPAWPYRLESAARSACVEIEWHILQAMFEKIKTVGLNVEKS